MSAQVSKLFFNLLLRLSLKQNSSDRGYIIVLVMSVMFILQALLMGYVVLARIEKSTTEASANSNTSFYGAEGALNLRAETIRQKFLEKTLPEGKGSNSIPTSTKDCWDSPSNNDGNGDFKCKTYEFSDKNAISYVQDLNSKDPVTQNPVPRKVKILPGELFENLDALEYRYRIVADAQSKDCTSQSIINDECQQESKQQMLIKIRNIPLFQFAAFYKDDLEFHPGSRMIIGGAVHSNSNIYFGAQNDYPNNLTVNGQISAVGDAYSRRKSNSTTFAATRTNICPPNVTAIDNTNCPYLFDSTYSQSLSNHLDRNYISSYWQGRLRVGVKNIKIPEPSMLNRSGDYYNQGDLRIQFNPTATGTSLPFAVQSVQDNGAPSDLSPGKLQSLRQPVMTSFCSAVGAEPGTIPADINTLDRKEAIAKALKVSIASIAISKTPLSYGSDLTQSLDTLYNSGAGKLDTVRNNVIKALQNSGMDATTATSRWTTISAWTLAEVAALRTTSSPSGGCFVASPLSQSNFYNSREDRIISLLQLNIAALTIWNKEGVYVEFASGILSNDNNGNGFSADRSLFKLYDADNDPTNGIQGDASAANGSFQKLGYAAADRTDGGLVIHASVDPSVANAYTTQSDYGFAVTNGKELPGLSTTANISDPTGVTIASDQAIYLQGDYNTVNKQPASILSDSFNILSKSCLNAATNLLTCGNAPSVAGDRTTRSAPTASTTTINAAFLAGTDVSQPGVPNGGLHNYPRLHENWTGATLTYWGSMVSLGIPLHVNGVWTDAKNWAYIQPLRDFNYDPYFNSYENLPPMTPNLVYLRQEVFSRTF